jgi:polyphenol oxidase
MKIFSYDFPQGQFTTRVMEKEHHYFTVKQVHGNKILEVTSNNINYQTNVEADGLLVKYQNFKSKKQLPAIAIKTADCLPILVIGKHGYALLHAGWKGIQQEIINQPIIQSITPITFFIGPHICSECYEVSPEFINEFPNSVNFNNFGNKILFNLSKETNLQIEKSFPNCKIITSKICTFTTKSFNSYRENKTHLRNINIFSHFS